MKILVHLSVWKRPEITELCFIGINQIKHPKYDVSALAVISEIQMIPLCDKYGIDWVMCPNSPLGKKKNFGMTEAMKRDFDYMIGLGSDDLLFQGILDLYHPYFKQGVEFLGLSDIVFLDSSTGECRLQSCETSPYGVGRAIKKTALEKMKLDNGTYHVWRDDAERAMDCYSISNFGLHGVMHQVVKCNEPMAVDIKSEENIWPFNPEKGSPYPIGKVMEKLSLEEQVELTKLLKRKKNVEKQVIR